MLHNVYIATLDIYNKTQSSEFLNHENHISTRNPIYKNDFLTVQQTLKRVVYFYKLLIFHALTYVHLRQFCF